VYVILPYISRVFYLDAHGDRCGQVYLGEAYGEDTRGGVMGDFKLKIVAEPIPYKAMRDWLILARMIPELNDRLQDRQ